MTRLRLSLYIVSRQGQLRQAYSDEVSTIVWVCHSYPSFVIRSSIRESSKRPLTRQVASEFLFFSALHCFRGRQWSEIPAHPNPNDNSHTNPSKEINPIPTHTKRYKCCLELRFIHETHFEIRKNILYLLSAVIFQHLSIKHRCVWSPQHVGN